MTKAFAASREIKQASFYLQGLSSTVHHRLTGLILYAPTHHHTHHLPSEPNLSMGL
jgi:hypothetical protein